MAVRKGANQSPGKYEKPFEKCGLGSKSSIRTKDGTVEKIKKELGSGYRARVVLTESGKVYKIPHNASSAFALETEAMITQHLQDSYDHYGIKALPILEQGENGVYLEKPLLESSLIASNILDAGGQLTSKQEKALEKLFDASRKYAKETGIGLDLKAANLYWDGTEWVLFDAGPRTSYLPYGFTLDVKDFKTYLKIFNRDEPPSGPTSIEEMIKRLERGK